MTAQSLIFPLLLLDILCSLVFSLDCLIIKRACVRRTLLPTHCIFIRALLMLLCLPLVHTSTITTHNTLLQYSLSFYQQMRLIFNIIILTIANSHG